MPTKFKPQYIITPRIVSCLLRIEASKEKVLHAPLTPLVLSSLRETARFYTTHYSTAIEGNRLDSNQVELVLKHEGHFPGRERDEREVRGYYAAFTKVECWAASGTPLTEKMIKTLHALLMGNGKTKVKSTEYRDGQNVIRDGKTKAIVYLPPEAQDVHDLMSSMIDWINKDNELPCPLIAAIAHYQFATIHPYYDGNGRTARLITTLILHLGGYDLKGIYSLEEYYARNLGAYYEALNKGESHNYYLGRAEADITTWIEYFLEGMAYSCEYIVERMTRAACEGSSDQSGLIKQLDLRQRKALVLFESFEVITSRQIGELFGFKPRTSTALCALWVRNGFLEITNLSNKGRKYRLSHTYYVLVNS
ncbi:Fic family protein [Candidatus Dependentiae bacterium]|nr:Fic family protein [Candidatus Dependentiae bacterium]